MRILITSHEPIDDSPVGRRVAQLAEQLAQAGHQVRLLVIDEARDPNVAPHIRLVVCSTAEPNAELSILQPRFASSEESASYASMNDAQIDVYRDKLRVILDEEIQQFDPHVLHAQHVWLWGHLALEAGIPYVMEAWGVELSLVGTDERWRRFAHQAAENAGRILVPSNEVAQRLMQAFQGLETEMALMPHDALLTEDGREALLSVYRAVIQSRGGKISPD